MPKKKLEKRPPAFEDDTSIFPYDILFPIIIRLPVKSLLRFQSVSKPWRAMISNIEFKKSYRDQSKALGREKILLGRRTGEVEFRAVENSELIMIEMQRIPLSKFQLAQVLCTCDGLALLKNPGAYKYLVLWNPSIREYQTLRCPYNYRTNIYVVAPTACGLCYDSRVDDYKVIMMMSDLFYGVYSLNNNSWTEKKACPFQIKYDFCVPGISIEGRVFWSFHNHRLFPHVDGKSTIIYFDIKLEEVKELPTPNFVDDEDVFFHLATLRSCLCLYGGNITRKELDIWIMEQDGRWKQLMNLSNLPTICQSFVIDMKILCCTKDGEVVFQGKRCRQLFIYNPKQQQFVTISDHENVFPPVASVCLDSLYFSTPNVECKRKQRSLTPNNQNSQ